MGDLAVEWLGRVAYGEALELQRRRVEARRRGDAPDGVLLLEHPAVVTLGRSARPGNLRVPESELADQGIEVHRVARGGDVTWHAPGQLVGYPILDLAARGERDVVAHLRAIEGVLIEAAAELGVPARRIPGLTGVFAEAPPGARPRKLASIGVGLRGWVTCHGFALNVDLDLAGFSCIVPCGLHQVEMTSLARELGARTPADLARHSREAVGRACARRWS
jgi:lipoyl(octanoyl) transferase